MSYQAPSSSKNVPTSDQGKTKVFIFSPDMLKKLGISSKIPNLIADKPATKISNIAATEKDDNRKVIKENLILSSSNKELNDSDTKSDKIDTQQIRIPQENPVTEESDTKVNKELKVDTDLIEGNNEISQLKPFDTAINCNKTVTSSVDFDQNIPDLTLVQPSSNLSSSEITPHLKSNIINLEDEENELPPSSNENLIEETTITHEFETYSRDTRVDSNIENKNSEELKPSICSSNISVNEHSMNADITPNLASNLQNFDSSTKKSDGCIRKDCVIKDSNKELSESNKTPSIRDIDKKQFNEDGSTQSTSSADDSESTISYIANKLNIKEARNKLALILNEKRNTLSETPREKSLSVLDNTKITSSNKLPEGLTNLNADKPKSGASPVKQKLHSMLTSKLKNQKPQNSVSSEFNRNEQVASKNQVELEPYSSTSIFNTKITDTSKSVANIERNQNISNENKTDICIIITDTDNEEKIGDMLEPRSELKTEIKIPKKRGRKRKIIEEKPKEVPEPVTPLRKSSRMRKLSTRHSDFVSEIKLHDGSNSKSIKLEDCLDISDEEGEMLKDIFKDLDTKMSQNETAFSSVSHSDKTEDNMGLICSDSQLSNMKNIMIHDDIVLESSIDKNITTSLHQTEDNLELKRVQPQSFPPKKNIIIHENIVLKSADKKYVSALLHKNPMITNESSIKTGDISISQNLQLKQPIKFPKRSKKIKVIDDKFEENSSFVVKCPLRTYSAKIKKSDTNKLEKKLATVEEIKSNDIEPTSKKNLENTTSESAIIGIESSLKNITVQDLEDIPIIILNTESENLIKDVDMEHEFFPFKNIENAKFIQEDLTIIQESGKLEFSSGNKTNIKENSSELSEKIVINSLERENIFPSNFREGNGEFLTQDKTVFQIEDVSEFLTKNRKDLEENSGFSTENRINSSEEGKSLETVEITHSQDEEKMEFSEENETDLQTEEVTEFLTKNRKDLEENSGFSTKNRISSLEKEKSLETLEITLSQDEEKTKVSEENETDLQREKVTELLTQNRRYWEENSEISTENKINSLEEGESLAAMEITLLQEKEKTVVLEENETHLQKEEVTEFQTQNISHLEENIEISTENKINSLEEGRSLAILEITPSKDEEKTEFSEENETDLQEERKTELSMEDSMNSFEEENAFIQMEMPNLQAERTEFFGEETDFQKEQVTEILTEEPANIQEQAMMEISNTENIVQEEILHSTVSSEKFNENMEVNSFENTGSLVEIEPPFMVSKQAENIVENLGESVNNNSGTSLEQETKNQIRNEDIIGLSSVSTESFEDTIVDNTETNQFLTDINEEKTDSVEIELERMYSEIDRTEIQTVSSPRKKQRRQPKKSLISDEGQVPNMENEDIKVSSLVQSANFEDTTATDINKEETDTTRVESEEIDSTIDPEVEAASDPPPTRRRKKRGRPKRSLIPDQNQEERIREKPVIFESGGKVTCAVCEEAVEKNLWTMHSWKHNFLCWKVGEQPIDLQNRKEVEYILNKAIRNKGKFKYFTCPHCNDKKKSVAGFLCHMDVCQLSEEERLERMLTCTICEKKVLPQCMKFHMNNHKTSSITEKNIIKPDTSDSNTSTSRLKRKAAYKAANLIQEVTSQESGQKKEVPAKKFFKKTTDRCSVFMTNGVIRKIEMFFKNGARKCLFHDCTFESNTFDQLRDHLNACPVLKETDYVCRFCLQVEEDLKSIEAHVTNTHLIDKYDYEKDISDDESVEESDGVDEDDEENNCNIGPKKMSKPSNFYSKKTYQIDFLAREKRIIRYPNCTYPPAIRWTNEFRRNNYSEDLFDGIKCWSDNIQLLDSEKKELYTPRLKKSMSVKNYYISRKIPNFQQIDHEWKEFDLYEAVLENDTATIFCGGPIWSVAWVPTPADSICDQYLAVSTQKDFEATYKISESSSGKEVIQFWNFGPIESKNKIANLPVLEFSLAHDHGMVWCMEWCPSGFYDTNDPEDQKQFKNLGLLALACSDGTVPVFPIGIPEKTGNNNIYKIKPAFKLILQDPEEEALGRWKFQATKISWSKGSGHNIIAGGFTNGLVCLWNLETTSPLLKSEENGVTILKPCHSFRAHSLAISALVLYPLIDGGQRWLLTGSWDRTFKYWDLNDTSSAVSNFGKRGVVTDGAWIPHWLCSFTAYDDVFSPGHTVTTVQNAREFGFKQTASLASNSVVMNLSASDWASAVAQGNLAGELIACFPRTILISYDVDKHLLCKRMLLSYNELVDKTKDVSERKDVMQPDNDYKVSDSNDDVNENKHEYVEEPSTYEDARQKYGIIFCDLNLDKFGDYPNEGFQVVRQSNKLREVPTELYPFSSLNRLSWNPNKQAYLFIASGYQNGFLRVRCVRFMNTYK